MPSRRPTLRDVAEVAGVSFKSVSRVVNGEAGVSPDLAARVREAVDQVGYRPDHRARMLRASGTTSKSIGFVVPDVENPFFSAMTRGIENVASTRGHLVLGASMDLDPGKERALIETLIDRRVDGLIVVGTASSQEQLLAQVSRGTPVVFADVEPPTSDIDVVRSDHYAGAVLATKHILAHGHRDIAYFGDDPSIFSAGLRMQGYRDAMTAAGLAVAESQIVTLTGNGDEWLESVLPWIEQHRPTAIFSGQNFATLGAVRALHRLGLQHETAFVGFDDLDFADTVEPALTVVPQSPKLLGERACDLLFRRIDGDVGPPVRTIQPMRLLERGSGEIVAIHR